MARKVKDSVRLRVIATFTQCPECGLTLSELDEIYPDYKPSKIEVDHIIPRREGGTHDESNLRPICFICNRKKSGKRKISDEPNRPILSVDLTPIEVELKDGFKKCLLPDCPNVIPVDAIRKFCERRCLETASNRKKSSGDIFPLVGRCQWEECDNEWIRTGKGSGKKEFCSVACRKANDAANLKKRGKICWETLKLTDEECKRLWSWMEKKENGCWESTRAVTAEGYTTFGLRRESFPTHRVAYVAVNGGFPSELLVLHSCDNRLCINPEHLSLGTNKDNSDDKMSKRRSTTNKFTDSEVIAIRNLGTRGNNRGEVSNQVIADFFGVNHVTIYYIVEGISYDYVKDSDGEPEIIASLVKEVLSSREVVVCMLPDCQNEFIRTKTKAHQKYCSNSCKHKSSNRRYAYGTDDISTIVIGVCECGNPVMAGTIYRKYCSDSCYEVARQRQNYESNERKKAKKRELRG